MMKAILIDGALAGRCVNLAPANEASQHWRASMAWSGLRDRYQDYHTVMTNETDSICIMSIHPEYTERLLIEQIISNLTTGGADQSTIDHCELNLDSGLFTKASLEMIHDMAAINLWVMQIQNAAVGKIK